MKNIILIFITYFFISDASSQNWTGAINSDWNNPSNWSTAPSNGDNIEIDPANYSGAMAQPIVNANSNFTPAEMLVQNGAQLTISAVLNTTDQVEIIGTGTIVTITNNGAFSLIGGGNNARLVFVDDAHLEMNGGSLSSGQRLLFELGATGTINSGTVTVGETIALVDGSPSGSSKLIQNGGTITTNLEFGFENEAGVYYPTFQQNGGTIHINGSLLWLGAAPGAGKGYFRSTGGSVFVTGTIGNDPTSTMGMQLELTGSSAVLENSGTSVQLLAGDSIVLNNHSTWKDLNSTLWQNDGTIYATDTSLFQAGNTIFNGTGTYQLNFMNVPTGKSLTHSSPLVMSISGDISIAGSFSHNANTLVLNGSKNQVFTVNSNNLSLSGLRVENKANGPADGGYGISLNTSLNISTLLELNDGIVVSAPTALIKLADNLNLSGQSDSTFITGYVEKTGNDVFVFPLGTIPDRYRPLSITAPTSVSTQIKVGYLNSSYPNLTPVEVPMQSVSTLEYWDFTNSNSSDLVSVTIGWNNALQSGLSDCTDISLTVWNGTQWVFVPSGTSGLCNGTNEGTLYSSGNLPANGPITIGFTSDVTQQHITLCSGDSITVGSNTYTQSGTYFDVLQDVNGDDSTVVTVVTISNPIINSITDNITSITVNAPTATSLMWINCLDGTTATGTGNFGFTFTPSENGNYAVIAGYNGCIDTSDCIIIDQLGISEFGKNTLLIYPNPVTNGEHLMITSNSTNFVIQSIDGKIIQPVSVVILNEKCEIELPNLTSGIYLITQTGSGNKNPQTSRFKVN
ncbi:T9SS type A sorting domain-containing protein [Fluviicola sp.]|uniref:T9SS type A sorting domain-containing protein n=1 Tax=Fluviicola sp. TaxID=1917219 RepID=UPI003D276F91